MLLRCLLCMYVFCARTSGTLSAGEREPVCQEIIQNEVAAMPEKIIYPIQPYFVLSSAAYYKKLSGLPAVSHFYRFTGNQNSGQCFAVPDGAVDIIFKCSKDAPSPEICGTVKQSEDAGFSDSTTYFGVRLLPGILENLGGASMKELMNHRYSLEEVLGTHGLAGEIADLDSFEDQIQLFTKVFSEKAGTSDNGSHRVASAVLHEIYENDGVIRVSELEQKLHYSRRHLVRSFEETTGLDIKSFSTYIRFQSVLKQLNEGRFKSLSEAAAAGGYFDQNHFQKDFKRFANITPGAYVKLLEDMRYQDKLIIL